MFKSTFSPHFQTEAYMRRRSVFSMKGAWVSIINHPLQEINNTLSTPPIVANERHRVAPRREHHVRLNVLSLQTTVFPTSRIELELQAAWNVVQNLGALLFDRSDRCLLDEEHISFAQPLQINRLNLLDFASQPPAEIPPPVAGLAPRDEHMSEEISTKGDDVRDGSWNPT
jgi:hypothetical protein